VSQAAAARQMRLHTWRGMHRTFPLKEAATVSRPKILKEIEEGILARNPARVEKVFARLDPSLASPEEILGAMTAGMEKARSKLKDGTCSIPEFLLCIDAFRQGVGHLRGSSAEVGRKEAAVVIGVVEGDVHDMGKNIVAGVLEASGYRVHDLGKDVPRDKFLESLKETQASLLALSTMMSTPLENMRDVIRWVRRLHPEVKILVGGAPLDERLARAIGADGYAEGAADVPGEAERVLAQRKRLMEIPVVAT
jgi:dimethylamine corrinoid protein